MAREVVSRKNELVRQETRVVPRRSRQVPNREKPTTNKVTKPVRKEVLERDRKRIGGQDIIDHKAIEELKNQQNAGDIQDKINISSIQEGVIITKDERFLKLIEIEPINFSLRDRHEKEYIVSVYQEVFRLSNIVNVQIKAITKLADPERYLDIVKAKVAEEENENTKKLAREYINFVSGLSERGALTRRFFMILEIPERIARNKRYSELVLELNELANQVKNKFLNCENHIVNLKDLSEQDIDWNEDEWLLETLYEWYNPRSSLNESVKKRFRNSLVKLCDELGINRKTTALEDMPNVPVDTVIAPRGLDFSDPSCVLKDGMYYGYLYIKSDGYPINVPAGWAYSLMSPFGEGVELDIFVRKFNRNKKITEIDNKIFRMNTTLISGTKNPATREKKKKLIQHASALKEELSYGQSYIEMMTIISVSALTKKDLTRRIRLIKDELNSKNIEVAHARLNIPDMFEATQPLNTISNTLFDRGKQNISSLHFAAISYIFYAFELSDDDGVVIGLNAQNQSVCIVDLFNTKRYKNANMVLIGTSGAGKTFTSMLLLLRMRMLGTHCFVLAPLKGHEFKRSCDAIGGSYILLASSSRHRINMLEIRNPGLSDDYLIDALENGGDLDEFGFSESLLAKKLEQLKVFFNLLIPDMSYEESSFVDLSIAEAYLKYGITTDNATLFKDPRNMSLGFKEMPILEDVWLSLERKQEEGHDVSRIYNILTPYVRGVNKMFNGRTNVDLSNKYMVLDISKLSEESLPIGMFICLDYCWDIIKQDRTKKKAILIDEAWKLINSNALAANFVLEIFKVIRGYRGAALAATQDLSDFYALEDGKYGKGIINNSKTKIILNLEPSEIRTIEQVFRLTPREKLEIEKFQRGEALLYAGSSKVAIQIAPSDVEKELITTDGSDLARIAKRKRAEIEAKQKMIG